MIARIHRLYLLLLCCFYSDAGEKGSLLYLIKLLSIVTINPSLRDKS